MTLWDWNRSFGLSPWHEIDRVRRRMGRLLSDVAQASFGGGFPPVNVRSNEEKAVVTAELPGIDLEDLDISVENDTLTIQGSRESEELDEGERFRRHERGHGAFRRTIALPFGVEADAAEADYNEGVLRVEMPRSDASKPRQIEIKD
ncbi:MAG: Hsp20/alpha crystallin family protein [Candidatus Brocadiia bacterium]